MRVYAVGRRLLLWAGMCCLVLGVLVAFVACSSRQPANKASAPSAPVGEAPREPSATQTRYELRWGAITAGGTWQVIGSAMLEDIKKSNPLITGSILPGNPTANVQGLKEGKFNVAFSMSDITAEAWNGKGHFQEQGPIRNVRELVALYPHASQIVVWADSGITSIDQLKGKRVSPGPKGTSSDLIGQRLLNLYGLSYQDVRVQYLSFEDAAQSMIDGHLDALLFTTVVYPFAAIINVNSQRQIRILSIPEDKIAALVKQTPGLEPHEVPAGIYKGVDYPVKGVASVSHILARDDMPEDVAYSIVKTIAENWGRYPSVVKSMAYVKLEEMARDVGVPYHPGALRYYRERGWVR